MSGALPRLQRAPRLRQESLCLTAVQWAILSGGVPARPRQPVHVPPSSAVTYSASVAPTNSRTGRAAASIHSSTGPPRHAGAAPSGFPIRP